MTLAKHKRILAAIANWHAEKACAHYRKDEMADYCRHIAIADRLRERAR